MENEQRSGRANDLSADDWIAAADRAIEEGGVAAVAVEPLARRLGVTKGSFYWHFKNRDALLEATLLRWEQERTDAVIEAVEGIADPLRRLESLFGEALADPMRGRRTEVRGEPVIGFRHAFNLAIGDAADHPIVGPVLRRVSERRIDYLEECYLGLGVTPDSARHFALSAYAAYLGTLRLAREAPDRMPRGEAFGPYLRHLIATLMPAGLGAGTER